MNTRERIETVLQGGLPDRVPFTIYPNMLPRGETERILRNRGLGFHWRRCEAFVWRYAQCGIERIIYRENGIDYERTYWRTPVGDVYSTKRLGAAYGSERHIDHPIKRRDDYRVVKFLARDARPEPLYDKLRAIEADLGNDGWVTGNVGYEPLQEMLIEWLGFQNFAYEMADNADMFWELHEELCCRNRLAFPVAAQAPVKLVMYWGNVSPQVIGVPSFEKYFLPYYEELGAYLHEEGKWLGTHLDADNRPIKDLLARSALDVICAFTPPPDCSLSLSEARATWPGKTIWMNFPSSVHLSPPDVIRQTMRNLLKEVAPGDHFIAGVTEDIPADRWQISLMAIMDVLEESGYTSLLG